MDRDEAKRKAWDDALGGANPGLTKPRIVPESFSPTFDIGYSAGAASAEKRIAELDSEVSKLLRRYSRLHSRLVVTEADCEQLAAVSTGSIREFLRRTAGSINQTLKDDEEFDSATSTAAEVEEGGQQ